MQKPTVAALTSVQVINLNLLCISICLIHQSAKYGPRSFMLVQVESPELPDEGPVPDEPVPKPSQVQPSPVVDVLMPFQQGGRSVIK